MATVRQRGVQVLKVLQVLLQVLLQVRVRQLGREAGKEASREASMATVRQPGVQVRGVTAMQL